MKIVQVTLQSKIRETFTTWVDKRPELKIGSRISLKDLKPETTWLVVNIYDKELDSKDLEFHRKWDNNNYDKHEGLKLRK